MTSVPELLWSPSRATIEAARLTEFRRFAEAHTGHLFDDYTALHTWSVADLEGFWRTVWSFYDVQADGDAAVVLASEQMPGAEWFPNTRLSWAEHIFRGKTDDAVALRHQSETRPGGQWTWGQLRAETARIRAGLKAAGVTRGDRVAAYMPNAPETIAALLATASLGAVWSSCSPDFGAQAVIDRFAQIEPVLLLTVDGYRYNGRLFDCTQAVDEVAAAIPSLRRVVRLPYAGVTGNWDAVFPETSDTLEFERVPFDHPLYILFTSGTTGLPKPITHGTGGILLEHLKYLGLHWNLAEGDRAFWFTTTGWMMWNALVSAPLVGAEMLLWDGSPSATGPDTLWRFADECGATLVGVGAAYVQACMKSGVRPRTTGRELAALRALGSTGSPLPPEGFRWVYDELGPDIWLFSTSGGTDVCSSFVGGAVTEPVRSGEIQVRQLGVDVQAFDDAGAVVIGEVGELVVRRPMPSMPVGFWGDVDGALYCETYFSTYPGVWCHGDWIRFGEHGSCVISGRSDATINRGGVRMGTAEIYRAALSVPQVIDALVIDIAADDGDSSWMPLFVVLADGADLDEDLTSTIRACIRRDCSPRHVPDAVIRTSAIPRTLSGKALEIPIKRLFTGADPASVVSREALAQPEAFDWFVQVAAQRRTTASS